MCDSIGIERLRVNYPVQDRVSRMKVWWLSRDAVYGVEIRAPCLEKPG